MDVSFPELVHPRSRPRGGQLRRQGKPRRALSISRIFAIMGLRKLARHSLLAPDFVAGPLWVFRKLLVPIFEVSVDSVLRSFHGLIVAVVNDRFSHSTEYRLDDVEELCPGGQWRGSDDGTTICRCLTVNLVQMGVEPFRNVPRRRIPRQIDRATRVVLRYFRTTSGSRRRLPRCFPSVLCSGVGVLGAAAVAMEKLFC